MKIKEPLNPLVRSVVKSNEKSQKTRPAPQGYFAPVAKVSVIVLEFQGTTTFRLLSAENVEF